MWINNYIHELWEMRHYKVVKDSAWAMTGQIVMLGVGALTVVLIARFLGPAEFGIFSLFLVTRMIMMQFSNFGLDSALIKFGSYYSIKNKLKSELVTKVVLKIKIFLTLVVSILGFLLSKSIALHLFEREELIIVFRASFIFIFFYNLYTTIPAILRRDLKFKKYAFLQSTYSFLLLLAIVFLIIYSKLSIQSVMFSFILISFLGIIMGSFFVDKKFLFLNKKDNELTRKILKFSKWIFISGICVSFLDQSGVYFITYFLNSAEAGYYSVANQLSIGIQLMIYSLLLVLIPRVSKYSSKLQIHNYIKRSLKVTIPLSLISIVLVLSFSPVIINILFGSEYIKSIVIFQILSVAFLLLLITLPISLILIYALNKPHYAAIINFLQVITILILYPFIIPRHGVIGMVISFGIIKIGGSIIHNLILFKEVYKKW